MRPSVLLAAFVLTGCGYFNTMYNAERRFAEAERAARRGDRTAAEAAWREAMDKAAASLRKDPDGRWADDALLIVGRAHFGLGRWDAAAAALERAVATADDSGQRGAARMWLGAARVEMGEPEAGRAQLDSALFDLAGDDAARAHLWRARAALALNRHADAWVDLEAAAAADDRIAATAYLEMAGAAIVADDSARHVRAAAAALAHDDHAADSVAALSRVAAARWGAAWARRALGSVDTDRLTSGARDRILLQRAQHAAAAGDTQAALDDARAASAGSGPVADRARVTIARWLLAEAADGEALAEAAAVLLPSLADPDARTLHEAAAAATTLIERGSSGAQPLALYAAAELTRDDLGAPGLARTLFLRFAQASPRSVWAPKAALAAAVLGAPAGEVEAHLYAAGHDNPYIAALNGHSDPQSFADAEARLSAELRSLHNGARAETMQRIDTVRVAADTSRARTP